MGNLPDFRNRGVSRRDLLRNSSAFLAAVSVTSCDAFSTDPASEDDSGGGEKDQEAPMLQDLVESGDLPPVEERLPDNPLVVDPVDRVGVYGGQWNTTMSGSEDTVWLTRTIGYDYLMTWDIEFNEPIVNIAESVESDEEGRTYTFKLREGMKWSDGEPFTADDIIFWFDDVLNNDQLVGVVPLDLTVGGEPPELEKVDDHTIRFSLPAPHGLFLQYLATTIGADLTAWPRHYMEQFHADYNDDVEAVVEEEGYSDWPELFLARGDPWANEDLPTLHAWRIRTPLGDGNRVIAERNPFYFKTDPDGSQLPYLDRVVYEIVNDDEVAVLKASDGELDMESWHVNTPSNKPVLARSREESDFRFLDMTWSWMNRMVIMLNLTHENENLREVFRNREFRIGLSHAINRSEMIDTVFQRQGEPWQAAPRPESDFFDEELAKQYTDYDVDSANEHLDRAGFTERDGDGYRLGPNGEPIAFAVIVPYPAAISPYFPDAMELVVGYWNEVGINARTDVVDRSLWAERTDANEHHATVWTGDGGLGDEILDPRYYFPYRFPGWSLFAPLWANWYNNEDPQEEPPEVAQQQMELYDQVKQTADEQERHAMFRELLQMTKEEFYTIGTVLPAGNYGIVKNNVHNVPEPMLLSWMYPTPGPTRPEQYFIEG